MTKDTTLRMAIEVFDMYGNKMNSAFADEAYQACKDALEQPTAEQSSLVQEPVIIKQENGMVLKLGYDELPNGTAFYTTPPSREWVGLSDEEIIEKYVPIWGAMINTRDREETVDFGRAIETKLREKNG